MCSYLFNCRKKCKFLGTATQDSSDCCYLWGMTSPFQLYVLVLCNKFAHFFLSVFYYDSYESIRNSTNWVLETSHFFIER